MDFLFLHAVAGPRTQFQAIELLEFPNATKGIFLEGKLPIKGVQDDAFEQISERYVTQLGKTLQDFQQSLFHAHTGLHAFDKVTRLFHAYLLE